MNHRITTLLGGLALALGSAAQAAGDHGAGHDHQPRHGGVVAEASDLDFELVAAADGLSLYVRDHGQPAPLDGASAKVTLLSGKDKAEAQLQPAGNRLHAPGRFPAGTGTKAVAAVTLPGRKPVNVRFAWKWPTGGPRATQRPRAPRMPAAALQGPSAGFEGRLDLRT